MPSWKTKQLPLSLLLCLSLHWGNILLCWFHRNGRVDRKISSRRLFPIRPLLLNSRLERSCYQLSIQILKRALFPELQVSISNCFFNFCWTMAIFCLLLPPELKTSVSFRKGRLWRLFGLIIDLSGWNTHIYIYIYITEPRIRLCLIHRRVESYLSFKRWHLAEFCQQWSLFLTWQTKPLTNWEPQNRIWIVYKLQKIKCLKFILKLYNCDTIKKWW